MTKHGTRTMYNNHGCRCLPCRDANSNYDRTYRGTGRPMPPPETDIETSERVIALERAKRRDELIGESLKPELKVQSTESVFSGLGFLMRKPKPVGHGWRCPVGCVSR